MCVNFSQLDTMSPADYARRLQSQGGLWFFHHIPKTAGSSLVRELSFCFPPYCNINGGEVVENRRAAIDAALDVFLAEMPERGWRAASGHLYAPHMAKLRQAVPHLRPFTFLRDPVDRLVSEFRYTRTPSQPNHAQYVARYPTIEAFAADPQQQDRMMYFLAPGQTTTPEEAVERVFRHHVFIGTIEALTPCFAFLSALDGHPKMTVARANVTRAEDGNAVDLTPDLVAMIRAANPRDVALYAAVTALLDRIAPAMAAFVEERRAAYDGLVAIG